MTEKDLIGKIRILNEIKPNKDWVVFSKNQILNSESFEKKTISNESFAKTFASEFFIVARFIFGHKYAFASALAVLVLVGTFGFSLKTTPGDTLFSLKKMVEDSQTVFMTNEGKINFSLDQANKRMNDLAVAAKENDTRRLDPAISEYKASMSAVAKNLEGETDKNRIKDVVASVKNLENKEEEIKSLGIELGENIEKDLSLVKLISDQVKEIEARKDLSSENRARLYQLKEYCATGYFTEALDLILVINNSK